MIKDNSKKSYKEFKEEMDLLTKEKEQIYKQNEEIIEKVLTNYLEEVKE